MRGEGCFRELDINGRELEETFQRGESSKR